jgi:hypothetical protein
MFGNRATWGRVWRAAPVLLVVGLIAQSVTSPAAADVIALGPDSVQNGVLGYFYGGNGTSSSSYEPRSTTKLTASNGYTTFATRVVTNYSVFAVDFDLSGFAPGSLVKNATLAVDEAIANYQADIRLYGTTGPVELTTFSAAHVMSKRAVAI